MLTGVFRLKCDPPPQRSWGAERGRLGLRSVGCIGRRGWRCGRLPGTCRSGKNTVKRALGAQGPPRYVRSPLGSAVDEFEPAIRGLLVEFPSMPTSVFVERVRWPAGRRCSSRGRGVAAAVRPTGPGVADRLRSGPVGATRFVVPAGGHPGRLRAGGPAAGIGAGIRVLPDDHGVNPRFIWRSLLELNGIILERCTPVRSLGEASFQLTAVSRLDLTHAKWHGVQHAYASTGHSMYLSSQVKSVVRYQRRNHAAIYCGKSVPYSVATDRPVARGIRPGPQFSV